MAGGEESSSSEIKLENTPTWIVASVCSVIVIISLIFERLLHHGGKVYLYIVQEFHLHAVQFANYYSLL